MFGERLLSGIILLAITIGTLLAGGWVMFGVLMAVSLTGLFELYRAVGMKQAPVTAVGYLSVAAVFLLIHFKQETYLMAVLVFAMMLFLAVYVLTYPKYTSTQISMLFFGIVYVPVLLSYVNRVRMMEGGHILVWLIFIGAWGSDTCAYCVGKLIGKHKLPNKLSPKKTIEGCVGGIAGAVLIGVLYAMYFEKSMTVLSHPVAGVAAICGAAAVVSQIGDLAASGIKRNHDIKDYGKLIPGHGGILDRFDSIIFIAPLVYYLLTWL